MKNVLLASTALIMSAGVAAAEVTVGGDGRMGIIDMDDARGLHFTSRIRISFAASGETDSGLSFGGSVRVDNYENDQATNGQEGSVFVSGAFGKLSMGDVSGAAEAAVGDLSGVGLTGLGDRNEVTYLLNSAAVYRPSALYEYSTGSLTFYASAENPGAPAVVGSPFGTNEAYGVGVKYSAGNYTVALGYENYNTTDAFGVDTGNIDHIVLGGTAAFGDATVKAIYGSVDDAISTNDQYGLSLDYVFGATTATAFAIEQFDGETDFGIGASYDLGGGAALKGGVVRDNFVGGDNTYYDFGVSMSF
ncbi:porin [Oceaniglobus ichthyenteri]|uniref:porin n=1 Tax=Oceaniglobus ichthyenteri TaxID=2136177 RepID=UPI000D3622B7|nr:porin [Oceaniglobus ichthyenteri]